MAMISLLCAVYEAMNQRIWTSGALTTIFVAAFLLFYFPQLETFKAAGIEVRLRQTLDRAEEIIERLKKLAEANAKVTYMTLAWGNRFGSPSAVDKQELLDEADAQLRALNVDEAERKQIAKPLVALVGVDLYTIYSQVMERFVFWTQQEENKKVNSNPTPEVRTENQKLNESIAAWRSANAGKGPGSHLQDYDLAALLLRNTPTAIMTQPQKAAAEAFRAQLVALHEGCVKKGGYTPDAAAFLDSRGGENLLPAADIEVKERFGIGEAGPPPR